MSALSKPGDIRGGLWRVMAISASDDEADMGINSLTKADGTGEEGSIPRSTKWSIPRPAAKLIEQPAIAARPPHIQTPAAKPAPRVARPTSHLGAADAHPPRLSARNTPFRPRPLRRKAPLRAES